jgi:hypothetical protein
VGLIFVFGLGKRAPSTAPSSIACAAPSPQTGLSGVSDHHDFAFCIHEAGS